MTTELTIEERIRLVEPEIRDTVFFIPHPRDITEKILDTYSIPRTKEYSNYLIYTTQGVLNNMDVVEGHLKDCIKGFEGAYTPFKESITFNYGFRPLSEEEFLCKGEEFVQDSRWYAKTPWELKMNLDTESIQGWLHDGH
jgi:hypothetical protein